MRLLFMLALCSALVCGVTIPAFALSPLVQLLEDQQTTFGEPASFPASNLKAVSRIAAFDLSGVNVGVQPFSRPSVPSETFGLKNQFRGKSSTLVSKHSAIHADLAVVAFELAPCEYGAPTRSHKNQLATRANEQTVIAVGLRKQPDLVAARSIGVVAAKQFAPNGIAVFNDLPDTQTNTFAYSANAVKPVLYQDRLSALVYGFGFTAFALSTSGVFVFVDSHLGVPTLLAASTLFHERSDSASAPCNVSFAMRRPFGPCMFVRLAIVGSPTAAKTQPAKKKADKKENHASTVCHTGQSSPIARTPSSQYRTRTAEGSANA